MKFPIYNLIIYELDFHREIAILKWTDITPITGWAWWFAYRGLVDIDIDLNHSTIWLVLLGRGECKQGKIMEHPNAYSYNGAAEGMIHCR